MSRPVCPHVCDSDSARVPIHLLIRVLLAPTRKQVRRSAQHDPVQYCHRTPLSEHKLTAYSRGFMSIAYSLQRVLSQLTALPLKYGLHDRHCTV